MDAFSPPLLQGIRAGLAAIQLSLVAATVRGCMLSRYDGFWKWVVGLGEKEAATAWADHDPVGHLDAEAQTRRAAHGHNRGSRLTGHLLDLAVLAASESPTPTCDPLRCFSVPSRELLAAIASRLSHIVGTSRMPVGSSLDMGHQQESMLSMGTEDTSSSGALLAGDALAAEGPDAALRLGLEGGDISSQVHRISPISERFRGNSRGASGIRLPTGAGAQQGRGDWNGAAPGSNHGRNGLGDVARALAIPAQDIDASIETDRPSPWIKATQHGDRMPWC